MLTTGDNIYQRCVGNFNQKIMQVLVPCLIFLAVENVQLVQNEHLDAQEVLDSTQFKNAVAKELLKKKLSNLESARQQDTLASFLKKGGKNTGLKTAPKSSFHKGDDPSRKQAQMANTFIASSNLLFGTKSQPRKSCGAGKQANKEGLDMGSLRQLSGYNEDGGDFTALKESSKAAVLNSSLPAEKKRLFPRKAVQDPISCYLSEPKKVTCMHKDIIYKIALPSSEVADDEIGRIVESIYRAVEGKNGGKSSLDEPIEGADSQKASLKDQHATDGKTKSEDSSKKKRASEDYLKSVFLNNMIMANRKDLPNNPVFIPLLIPMAQPKPQVGYYSGLPIDPRLQVPLNLSAGVDALGHQAGRNVFENGRFLVPDGLALPELNLKQRSQVNTTEEEEKRRNWLALMATNGLVPIDNKFIAQSLTQPGELQRITEEKESIASENKLTLAETGEVLDKLLNKRQERDTYSVRRQMKTASVEESPILNSQDKHVLSQVVQKQTDPGDFIVEEKKGCPCPCSTESCATASRCTRKTTKSSSKCPMKMIFQLTSSSSFSRKCSTTQKCSTCPEGCQPIPSCPETTTKPCSTSKCCGDSDILSRVVSAKGNEEKIENRQHLPLLPIQTSHLNWLPYSPQLSRQNEQPSDRIQPMADINGETLQPGPIGNIPMERNLENRVLTNSEQPQTDQLQNEFKPQHLEKLNDPLEHPVTVRPSDHNRLSPENSLVQTQIVLNNANQPVGQNRNIEGYITDAPNQPGTRDAPSKHELRSKPLPQADQSNVPSKQNDIKTKKHRDSFFARLRSKFLKGLPQNGTDGFQVNQDSDHILIHNKAMLGTSIFKFSPKNQTLGKNSPDQMNTTQTVSNQQQCIPDQMNLSNDQNQTLNQTQPSTINNINITISSMQPHPIVQGQPPNGNQTNQPQPSNRVFIQCPMISSCTAQQSTNNQNGRTCKVTKIWLCTRPTTSTPCDNITRPSTCRTPQTTTCATTQPSTCRTPSTTRDGNSCPIQEGKSHYVLPQGNPEPVSRNENGDTPQNMQLQHSNMWPAPVSSQVPQPAPQDISQEASGSKLKTKFNYSPPGWNQWQQYSVETRNNAPPTERVSWQQPPRLSLPTPFVLHAQEKPEPRPTQMGQPGNPAWLQNYMQPQNQQPMSQQFFPRWQAPYMEAPKEYQPNFYPRFQDQGDTHDGYGQPMKSDMANFHPPFPNQGDTRKGYGQPIKSDMPNFHPPFTNQGETRNGYGQPIKSDMPNFHPPLPNQGETRNGYGQPIKSDMQYSDGIEMRPYNERTWMKSTTGSGTMTGMRKPNIIEHIARVRRYLWRKRSTASSQHPSIKR